VIVRLDLNLSKFALESPIVIAFVMFPTASKDVELHFTYLLFVDMFRCYIRRTETYS